MAGSSAQLFAQISDALPPARGGISLRRAVVLGGSVAGLMAARVLSEHAEEVVIVERDGTAGTGGPRPGVPQGSQVHALLPAGVVQLERWFPGFAAEAVAAGAVTPPRDGSREWFYTDGRRWVTAPIDQDWTVLVSTRPFLEALIHRRTLAVGNIRRVTGLAEGLDFDGDRVVGARYTPLGSDQQVTLEAELVVDAMGRSSRLGDWLDESGWERPPMRRMPIKLNYATSVFQHDGAVSEAWNVVSTAAADPAAGSPPRIGGVILVEDHRWMVLVAGYADDRPSRDAVEFGRRCREDFPQVFGDIAERAKQVSEVVTYHQADSRRRDFHELRRFPAGLVATGDAVASFNPVYGQGMTSAMLHASCLSAYLHAPHTSLREPASGYFEQVKVVVDAAWQVSTFADLELPHVDGPYPRGYRLIRWVGRLLFELAVTDAVISERVARTTTMLAHPDSLASPRLLARALRLRLFRRAPAAPAVPAADPDASAA